MCVIELTPSKPAEKADYSDELVLSPSMAEERSESMDLALDAESIAKIKVITFEGEEDAKSRFEEAMTAYDEAMDQAAGIK